MFKKLLAKSRGLCTFLTTLLFAVAFSFHATSVVAQDKSKTVHDAFDTGSLDRNIWCPCQINLDASPPLFPKDAKQKHYLRLMADEASLGGNKCRFKPTSECAALSLVGANSITSEPSTLSSEGYLDTAEILEDEKEPPEFLGPSLIQKLRRDTNEVFRMNENGAAINLEDPTASHLLSIPSPPDLDDKAFRRRPSPRHLACEAPANSKVYCSDYVHLRVKEAKEEDLCIQRQEMRLRSDMRPHASNEPMWYSIRFRMPSSIEDTCNSVRWVTAQWKHKHGALADKEIHQSPMLAQRFDDGVLHVTIQDGACRCIVASAPDPRALEQIEWKSGRIPSSLCVSPTQPNGCSADLSLEYSDDPTLTSPIGEWTTMTYYLKSGWKQDGKVEVYQDGRHIVSVSGDIGYEIGNESKNKIKFKFGHYRDYMPYHHEMDVEAVTISFDPPPEFGN